MDLAIMNYGSWTIFLGVMALLLASHSKAQQDNEVSPEFLCPAEWTSKPCSCVADQPPNLPNIFCDQSNDHDLRSAFESLPQQTAFQTLNVTNSKLTSLPVSSLKMASFSDIVITKTALQKLDVLAGQNSLLSLRLMNNDLQTFNFSLLQGLPNLRHFALTGNRHLMSIPANAFPFSTTLRFVNLSHNFIDFVGPNAFAKLQNLDLLDLNSNRLTSLEPGAFNTSSVQTPLVLLDLSHNNISKINPEAFHGLKTRSLDLKSNNLTTLEDDQFQSFLLHGNNEFVSLLVGGNPFSCKSANYSWLLNQPKTVRRQVIGFPCLSSNTTNANSMEHHTASNGEKDVADPFVAVLSLLMTAIAMKLFLLHNLKSLM